MRLIPVALIVGVIAFIPPRAAARTQQSFEDLGRHVQVGKQLQVEDRSGAKTTGRLSAVTGEQITLETNEGERRFLRETVATVAVRRSYAGWGALIGAGAGAVVGYVSDSEHHDVDLPALLGAGGGALVGKFIPRMKTVYRAGAEVSIAPEVSHGARGAAIALRW